MITIPAVFIILFIKPYEIIGQTFINNEVVKDFNLKSKHFGVKVGAKISEAEIRHVLKSLEPHNCRVRDPSKYCRSFRTCYECISSMKYPCNWCHNFGCSYKEDKVCSIYKVDAYEMKNLSCPFIYTATPILIAAGAGNYISMKINMPDPALKQTDLICELNLKNHMIHSKGIIAKNVVYCFPPRVMINSGREVASLKLLWDGVEPYSNELSVYVYRCEMMASNCLDCKRLPSRYGCSWCDATRLCVAPEKCPFAYSRPNKACEIY